MSSAITDRSHFTLFVPKHIRSVGFKRDIASAYLGSSSRLNMRISISSWKPLIQSSYYWIPIAATLTHGTYWQLRRFTACRGTTTATLPAVQIACPCHSFGPPETTHQPNVTFLLGTFWISASAYASRVCGEFLSCALVQHTPTHDLLRVFHVRV